MRHTAIANQRTGRSVLVEADMSCMCTWGVSTRNAVRDNWGACNRSYFLVSISSKITSTINRLVCSPCSTAISSLFHTRTDFNRPFKPHLCPLGGPHRRWTRGIHGKGVDVRRSTNNSRLTHFTGQTPGTKHADALPPMAGAIFPLLCMYPTEKVHYVVVYSVQKMQPACQLAPPPPCRLWHCHPEKASTQTAVWVPTVESPSLLAPHDSNPIPTSTYCRGSCSRLPTALFSR